MMEDREDIKLHMPVIEKFASLAYDILEIGPDFGNGSTRAIQNGVTNLSTYSWVTVDIDDHILPECRPTFPGWYMVVGDSREQSTVDTVSTTLMSGYADLIFIDTIYDKGFLAKELSIWKKVALPSTVWLFHDTWIGGNYNPMTDAIKEFAQSHPQWKYVDISKECNGLGALIPVDRELSEYGI
jgi:hypothetical protein